MTIEKLHDYLDAKTSWEHLKPDHICKVELDLYPSDDICRRCTTSFPARFVVVKDLIHPDYNIFYKKMFKNDCLCNKEEL